MEASNGAVMQRITSELGIQEIKAISKVNENIQPSLDVNPKYSRVYNVGERTSSGAITLYTTPTDKDFFLTYARIALIADANQDGVVASLSATIDGVSKYILHIDKFTLTATISTLQQAFPHPIKIDRNTSISVNATRTAGTHTLRGAIGGFLV